MRFNFRGHWADSADNWHANLGQPRSVSWSRPHLCGVGAAVQASCLQCQQRKQGKWKNIYCIAWKGDHFFFFQLSLSPHWRANFFPENHQQISPMSLVQSSIKCPFPGEGKSTISIDKTSKSFLMAKVPSLIIFLNNMPECLRKATIHVCYRRHWLLNQGKMMSPKIYPLYSQNVFTLSLQYPFLYGHCKNEIIYSASLEYHLQLHCFQTWKNIVTHETNRLSWRLSVITNENHTHTHIRTHTP